MIPANVEYFFRLAAEKAVAKMRAEGHSSDKIVEFLMRPGHLASLIEYGRELHFQTIEFVEQNLDEFARDVQRAMS